MEASMESASTAQEEMLRLLNQCKIKISNYVYTIKIVIDRQASINDPRICKEERSTYIPEPFATYVASLDHVRNPSREDNPYDRFDTPQVDSTGKPYPEYDPYVFAMLSGLRSMSEETEEYVNSVVTIGGTSGDASDPGKARERYQKRRRDSNGNPIHIWNDDAMIDKASKEAILKGSEIHGLQSYSVSPFDRFDLMDLVRKFAPYSAKCNLPRFAAVILRTYKPSASCSIFAPKKAVNTGARTDGVGQYSVMKTLLYLREKGYKRACPMGDTFTAVNVVATFILPFRIDLDKLCATFPDIVSYNPETFPGVRVRAPQISPAAQLVFATGRVVTMGGRSPPDHVRALSSTFPMYFSVREI
jgi:TATA-box binding protein (TBP) (component of TFIID and TFIIIB)